MFYRRLTKTGQVFIPKKMEKQLRLKEGHYLYLYISEENIIIVKHHSNKTLNQCIYRNGKISIPAELRRLVGISFNTPLEITLDEEQDKIIIKVENERFLKQA